MLEANVKNTDKYRGIIVAKTHVKLKNPILGIKIEINMIATKNIVETIISTIFDLIAYQKVAFLPSFLGVTKKENFFPNNPLKVAIIAELNNDK